MDYTKFTKEQLIEKLEDLQHLSSAVREKDKEISELSAELKVLQNTNVEAESSKLQEAYMVNKELVDENKELTNDLRYLIQTMNVFLNNFQSNAALMQVLLQKHLNGGQ
jgi:hypothetical protein